MTKRFEQAYNALYNAFMNDTLAKGSCRACAVGNMIADAQGGTIKKEPEHLHGFTCNTVNSFWSSIFLTFNTGEQQANFGEYLIAEKMLEELTSYTAKELAQVEHAFETNAKIHYIDYSAHSEQEVMEDQFNGLMAVMDVLIKLDEISEGETYKNTFKNKFATV